jgi:hypothetical protein
LRNGLAVLAEFGLHPAFERFVAQLQAHSRPRAVTKCGRNGATIDEIVKKFDGPPHTVRGAFAGALKKKLGLNVRLRRSKERGRVYRLKP